MHKIIISDVTLARSADRGLLFREKTALAVCACGCGADSIELPPVKKPKEDAIINRTIAGRVHGCEIAIGAGESPESVKDAYESVKNADSFRLQISLPVSTVTMEYLYHLKADGMIGKISSLVEEAKKYSKNVEFVALDATRADRDFLKKAITAAEEAGAGSVTLCDDSGDALPEEISSLVEFVKSFCGARLFVSVSDRLGMAISNAVYAAKAGADGLKVSMYKDGSLNMSAFSNFVFEKGSAVGIRTSLRNTEIKRDIEEVLKNVGRYEGSSEESGGETENIMLSSSSTVTDVTAAAEKMGYELSADDTGKVHKALMNICEKKPYIGAREFEAIVASSAMQAPSTYHLESYNITCSNLTSSMSSVVLTKDGERLSGIATGDGPIDAAFLAVEQCVGHHYELDGFQIGAVTEGREALGSALVKLRFEGKLYSGSGLSSDIVGASIRAYVNALNKIVYEETK